MKVKVTPPYDGAGSFVVEAVNKTDESYYYLKDGSRYPVEQCEIVPDITPEPGDIVEGEHGLPFFYHPAKTYSKVVRVLARKPMGGLDAHDAIGEFYRDISEADTASAEVIAYNKFLSAILGVPYARVGE